MLNVLDISERALSLYSDYWADRIRWKGELIRISRKKETAGFMQEKGISCFIA